MIALVFLKKNTVVTYDTDYIYFSEYNWISLEFSEFPLMCSPFYVNYLTMKYTRLQVTNLH